MQLLRILLYILASFIIFIFLFIMLLFISSLFINTKKYYDKNSLKFLYNICKFTYNILIKKDVLIKIRKVILVKKDCKQEHLISIISITIISWHLYINF